MKFLRPLNDQRKPYDSYCDLFRLAELSGFEIVEQDQFELGSDETYIVAPLNGNVRAWATDGRRKCRLIGWQLERPDGKIQVGTQHDFLGDGFDEIWISDWWLANQQTDERVRYVAMGGHPGLGVTPQAEKEWDFAVMSYVYGRREQVINDLKAQGYTIAPNGWGEERNKILARCRMGLCVHQDEIPVLEPLRATLFSMCRLPLVYERCNDFYPYRVWSLDNIEEAKRDECGKAAANYELLTGELGFRRCIEEAMA